MPSTCVLRSAYRSPQEMAGLDANASVLLAFSGGADSMALLHLLAEDAKQKGFSLTLAHVNHGIRGEEALRDRDFCRAQAERYGLEICILDADVPALAAQSGRGLEEEARALRYAYFESLMQEKNIPVLVTAHHADDQLETVLFHLARGCALRGLCGIPPVRPFGDGFLVRPFLEAPRTAILQLIKDEGLSFVSDSTNEDVTYARNKLRREVVPALEELFSNPQERVAAMTAALREDQDALLSMANAFLEDQSGEDLSVKDLLALHPAVAKRGIVEWIRQRTGISVQSAQLLSLWELLTSRKAQAEVTLGKGVCAVIERDRLSLKDGEETEAEPFCIPVCLGETVLPASGIRILVKKEDERTKVHNLSTTHAINYRVPSVIMKRACWRSREAGDVILVGGMHRKLRKLYNAKGIPTSLRERLPLLCDGDEILLAPMIGVKDGIACQEGDECLSIEIILP